MDKKTWAKVITTIICMIVSLFVLYTFIFIADISKGWRAVLIIVAIAWIISGISNLVEYLGRKNDKN